MTQTSNTTCSYTQSHELLIFEVSCPYHLMHPYLLVLTYTATISKKLASTELILSQLISRSDRNFTYNNIFKGAANELKAS